MGELLGAVALGVGATITPCILPLYPAFLAYLTSPHPVVASPTGATPTGPFPPLAAAALVWVGVVLGMVTIGVVFALLTLSLSGFIRVVLPLADGLLILLGALLLAGRNPFARLPQLAPTRVGGLGPAAGALGYGLLFAPIAVPCSGPFLVGIFALSLTIGDVASQLTFFLFFGIGFGMPLFLLGAISQVRGAELAHGLIRWERPLQVVLGLALVVIGLWDLNANLANIVG